MNDREPMLRSGFTKREAKALLGRVFETISALPDISPGARGIVISAARDGQNWRVCMAWELRSGQRRRSNCSKYEVQQCLREIIQPK